MSRLDQEPDVMQLASELGVEWRSAPVQNIIAYCRKKIDTWVKDAGPVPTIVELEQLVCRNLRLVFEEVWTDDDLARIMRKYIALGEGIFATLKCGLDESTFATLFERRNVTAAAPDRYVAVIDCRGEKALRRFFTRWHEIAHLLTLARQLEFPFHRSTTENTPLERLMDAVAGDVGFYEPIFLPAVTNELRTATRLTFQGIDAIRSRFCPVASFQSTLYAAVRMTPTPVLYIEVGYGLKKHEEAELRAGQRHLFPTVAPVAALRVLRVTANDAARKSRFRVDRNMLVPEDSIVATQFAECESVPCPPAYSIEELDVWRHSDGSAVGSGKIHVEMQYQPQQVVALLQPANDDGFLA